MSASSHLRKNALLILTIIAVCAGIGLGFFARTFSIAPNSTTIRMINFPGEIFLRGIKLLIIPLITSSLIVGIAGNSVVKSGAVARRTLLFFFITTLQSAILGVILVLIIQPGKLNRSLLNDVTNATNGIHASSSSSSNVPKLSSLDTFMDLIRNLVPDNLIEMCFQIYRSKIEVIRNENGTSSIYRVVPGFSRGVNILGLALYSCTFGVVLSRIGQRGQVMLKFFESLNEIAIQMIRKFMWFSPFGVCSLVCISIIQMDDPVLVFTRVIFYFLTLCLTWLIHGAVVLPLMYFLITRQNVWTFTKHMIQVFLMAFATASSSATLPTSIECIEKNAGISPYVSRVVLPCGIIVNKDGTAIYYVITTTFLAQLNFINLSIVDLITNASIAILISAGGSGVPGGHLVNSILLLSLLGIPITQISLLFALDWLIDRFMTIINCWTDCIVCGIVAYLTRKHMNNIELKLNEEDVFLENPDNLESLNTRV